MSAVIVLDVGKTVSKLSLWSPEGGLIARQVRENARVTAGASAVLDVDGISEWLISTLTQFAALADVGHIIPVAHGAGLAILRSERLVMAPLDYETKIPDDIRLAYASERDAFDVTGSPYLADGLNAGTQLYWLSQDNPGILDQASIMPWAQYWAWYMSGEMRSEVTSLGCHTDLWSPKDQGYSPMACRLGWADRFAPIAFAGEPIGNIRADLAHKTGLSPDVLIHCGLHDSNAALVAASGFREFAENEATIVSTGTWFVTMRRPGKASAMNKLPDGRDCLINVDAWSRAVPSARFMGGREIEGLVAPDAQRVDRQQDQAGLMKALPDVVGNDGHLVPCFAPGFGPFPENTGHWVQRPETPEARGAAICLYAALMTNTCLDLVGSSGTILVEGRFAQAEPIVRALASLRPGDDIYVAEAQNDVSFGALRLINPRLAPQGSLKRVSPLQESLDAYRESWVERVAETTKDCVPT